MGETSDIYTDIADAITALPLDDPDMRIFVLDDVGDRFEVETDLQTMTISMDRGAGLATFSASAGPLPVPPSGTLLRALLTMNTAADETVRLVPSATGAGGDRVEVARDVAVSLLAGLPMIDVVRATFEAAGMVGLLVGTWSDEEATVTDAMIRA